MSEELAAHKNDQNFQVLSEGINNISSTFKDIFEQLHQKLTESVDTTKLIEQNEKGDSENSNNFLNNIVNSFSKLIDKTPDGEKNTNILEQTLQIAKTTGNNKNSSILGKIGNVISKMASQDIKLNKNTGKNWKNIIKLIKGIEDNTEEKEKTKTFSAADNSNKNSEKTGSPQLDSNAIASAMSAAVTKCLNVVTMIKTFLTVVLPKIIIFGLLLLIFIETFFDVDILDAIWFVVGIIIAAVLAYIAFKFILAAALQAFQFLKENILLIFQMACEVIKIAIAAGPATFAILMIGIVAIAFLVLCPFIILALAGAILLIAIAIAIVVKFLSEAIIGIISTITDSILKIVDKIAESAQAIVDIIKAVVDGIKGIVETVLGGIGKFFGSLFGGGNDHPEVSTQDAADMVEKVGKECYEFLKIMENITNVMLENINSSLKKVVGAYIKFTATILSILFNPFTWIKKLTNSDEKSTNTFKEAIDPLIRVTKDIFEILSVFATNIRDAKGIAPGISLNNETTNINNSDFKKIISDSTTGAASVITSLGKNKETEILENISKSVIKLSEIVNTINSKMSYGGGNANSNFWDSMPDSTS